MDLGVFNLMVMILLPSAITDMNLLRYLIRNDRDNQGYFLSTLVLDQPVKQKVRGPWEIEMEHNDLSKADGNIIQTIAKALVRTNKGGDTGGEATTDDTYTNDPDGTSEGDSNSTYIKFPGVGCLRLYKSPGRYLKAQKRCKVDTADLAVISSKLTRSILDQIIGDTRDSPDATCAGYYYIAGKSFFYGINNELEEGKYYTSDGEVIDNERFVPWGPDQPNDPANENCVAYFKENGLHDVPCGWSLSFICQKSDCNEEDKDSQNEEFSSEEPPIQDLPDQELSNEELSNEEN